MIVVIDPFDISASLRVLTMARKLGKRISAVMFGGNPLLDMGISKIYMVRSLTMPKYVTVRYADVVCRILKSADEDIVMFPSTGFCRSLAPRVAAKLGCGLTSDCIDFAVENGELLQIAPAFSGNALATIVSTGGKIKMMTISANCPSEKILGELPEIIEVKTSLGIHGISESIGADLRGVNPSADIILSAGFGIGSSRNFDRLQRLADRMGASVGATLAAVNSGFAPHELLIGQTGVTVSPRVYMAFGISGHIQHTIGIAESATIVSVNTDADSAMSIMADYAVVADASETIEKMLQRYE